MCFKNYPMVGIFTRKAFNSWAALIFNASGLMDNKLACDRVVTNVSGNCSVRKTKSTAYSYVLMSHEER